MTCESAPEGAPETLAGAGDALIILHRALDGLDAAHVAWLRQWHPREETA